MTITIQNIKSIKGKTVFGKLKIPKSQSIPLIIMSGKKPGKTILICSGMQGNEINGISIVQKLLHSLKPKQLQGTIIFIPILSLSAYKKNQRNIPSDNMDLNRAFPGNLKGTESFRIAKTLFEEVIKKVDLVLDCHDSGSQNILLPHSRIHINEQKICIGGCTETLGMLLNTKIILQRKGKKGMLSVEANKKLQLPVLTIEVGGGLIIWDKYIQEILDGIKNILIYNKVLKGKVKKRQNQLIINDSKRKFYTAKISGLLHFYVKLGEKFSKNQILGKIHDPIKEKSQKIIAKETGIVFSRHLFSRIEKGNTIMSILKLD